MLQAKSLSFTSPFSIGQIDNIAAINKIFQELFTKVTYIHKTEKEEIPFLLLALVSDSVTDDTYYLIKGLITTCAGLP
jgi:hypothetical protein